jgi:hypothetical protein
VETAWTIAVGAVLLLWLVASVIHQFGPGWWKPVNAFDACRLLPQWHFFAPRPGRRDHYLVVRDVVDGVAGAWRQVDVGGSPAGIRWIFNPYRYRQKALTDLTNLLLTARRALDGNESPRVGELLSIPYLATLTWVMAQPGNGRACTRQFAVVSSMGHGLGRELRVVYLSRLHAMSADGD